MLFSIATLVDISTEQDYTRVKVMEDCEQVAGVIMPRLKNRSFLPPANLVAYGMFLENQNLLDSYLTPRLLLQVK